MKIDIRNEALKATELVFGDHLGFASSLVKASESDSASVYIKAAKDDGSVWSAVAIRDLLDAEHMISALECAIDLGWFNK
ncbi:hypothetical protein [Pseudomonas phage PA10]|uniref:Uncharacterized protein n=1 Tax=Pseudomonas phage PA10 TaxID=1913575 RepID=A0A1J0MIF2_9CAUD|nr:hypothetical protein FDH20_gp010 [Pseudomonas phage PA10]APD20809.1 hypothetical protein [Pseudomonas phage PA10]